MRTNINSGNHYEYLRLKYKATLKKYVSAYNRYNKIPRTYNMLPRLLKAHKNAMKLYETHMTIRKHINYIIQNRQTITNIIQPQ